MSTRVAKFKLERGKTIGIEVNAMGGDQKISAKLPSFDDVTAVISDVSRKVLDAVAAVHPQKASVEFGLEIGVESGGLIALIAKEYGSATFKIVLEWGKEST